MAAVAPNVAVISLFQTFGTAEDLASSEASAGRLAPRWHHAELVGRLVEISGRSALTAAMGIVLSAQQAGEPVAWISGGGPLFYPSDVAEGGVDLEALILVRVQGADAAARAGDRLIRSGAFGLIVLDLGAQHQVAMALQARLTKLTQKYASAVLVITEKEGHRVNLQRGNFQQSSLSSLVSLRCVARREWIAGDRFRCTVRVIKDKRRGPAWSSDEELRAPSGVG